MPAVAHPLGNFTINHLAELRSAQNSIFIRYVLDIAEIPSFQIMRERSANGRWTAADAASWANAEVNLVKSGVHLSADGTPLALRLVHAQARTRPGAGGLPTLYWTADFTAMRPAGSSTISIVDDVYADRRIGWRDIVAGTQTEPTHELQVYPSALIGSPRAVTKVSFTLDPSGKIANFQSINADVPQQQGAPSIVSQTYLSQMFMRTDRGPVWILITILAAFGFGALHAIEPGHGKALLAFTLVGARATTRQAAILAASLTFAHTIGVVLLGVVLFFVTGFVPEAIYPWITLVSGIVIAIVGGRALSRYVRSTRPFSHGHVHAHGGLMPHAHTRANEPAHEHEHGHAHQAGDPGDVLVHAHGGATHTHVVPGIKPLNFASAVWAALSGGIAPCPAAIILLIAAVNSHRIGYGLLLIVIFGMGLASVLTGLGIAVVRGAAWIASNAKYERVVRFGPLISAALISIIGSVLLGQGFIQIGVRTNVVLVAGAALCAIAGYAFSSHHVHKAAVQIA